MYTIQKFIFFYIYTILKFYLALSLMSVQSHVINDDRIYFPDTDFSQLNTANKSIHVNNSINVSLKCPNSLNPNRLLPSFCGLSQETIFSRIDGGTDAKIGEIPWIVLLQYRTPEGFVKTSCGGSLINDRYVLTAAHCVKPNSDSPPLTLEGVRLGEYNIETEIDCQGNVCAPKYTYISIEEKIVHDDWNPDSVNIHNDIALLRLAKPIRFSRYIQPICLPQNSEPSHQFIAAGWGESGIDDTPTAILQKVELPSYHSFEGCKSIYAEDPESPRQIISSQFCAGGLSEVSRDTCASDSGGPLMQTRIDENSEQERWFIIGITSYGAELCGLRGQPSVYTKVYSFLPWILCKLRP